MGALLVLLTFLGQYIRKVWSSPVSRNAAGLYILQFSSFVLPLLVLPYLARVLQPEALGRVAFFQSFALWFSMLIEYGFNLSATREVASLRGKVALLAEFTAKVQGAKICLFILSLSVFPVIILLIPLIRENYVYTVWALLQSLAFGFSPYWYFQGTERLLKPVMLEALARATATSSVFLFVLRPEDGWKVIAAQAVAGLFTTILPSYWMYKEIGWARLNYRDSIQLLRQGWSMFTLRSIQSLYTSANAFILGIFASPLSVGYFSGSERLYRAIIGLSTPALQALYPYLNRLNIENPNVSRRVFIRILLVTIGASLAVSLSVLFEAPKLIQVVLGPGYELATPVLRILALAIPINLVSATVIMLRLLPERLEATAGKLVLTGGMMNILLAALLAPRIQQIGMSWAVVAAELTIFIGVVLYLYPRLKERKGAPN